jgi:hypothetical protein
MNYTQLSLQSMPGELIFEVLKFLKWKDVANFAQTCKQMNEIVGSNSKLLEIVCCNYTENISEKVHFRKYTKFKLEGCTNGSLENFKTTYADNLVIIKEISLGAFNGFNIAQFWEILALCKNLKILKFTSFFSIDPETEEAEEEATQQLALKLDSLMIHNNFELLKHFEYSSIKSLTLYQCTEMDSLKKFLATQVDLEELKLEVFREFPALIDEDYKFRLKILTLYSCAATPELAQFLAHNRNSIKHVSLTGVVSSALINLVARLEEIDLTINFQSFVKSEPIEILRNIKRLSLTCKQTAIDPIKFSDFDGKTPNIISLQLDGFYRLKPTATFERLENCSIKNTTMQRPLSAPKVKNYVFNNVVFQLIRMPFDFNRSCVENLEVKRCIHAAWVYLCLQHPRTNLNSLIFYNKIGAYEREIELRQNAIDSNRHKVKFFKLNHY